MSAPKNIKSPEQVDLDVDSGEDDEVAEETHDTFDVNALDAAKPTPKGATTPSKFSSSPKASAFAGLAGQSKKESAPEERANWLSFLTLWFVQPLVFAAYRKPLEQSDLEAWPICEKDKAVVGRAELESLWEGEKRRPKPSLLRAVFRMTCWPLVAIAAMDLTVRGLTVLGPLVLERIVLWLVDPSQDTHVGYLWALAMLGIPLASAFLNAHAQGLGIHCYIRVKSGLANLVYSKSLTFRKTSDATAAQPPQPPVSPPSPKKVNQQAQAKAVPALPPSDPHSTGNLMNLLASDADKIGYVRGRFLHGCCSPLLCGTLCVLSLQMFLGSSNSILVPAEIAVIIYLLYDSLGPATFAGLGIILLMLPFLGLILVKLLKYHRLRLGLADKRVKLSSEILQGIRILKFYAWEDSFLSRVNGLRQSELDILRKYNIYQSLIIVVFLVLPVWMSLTTFGVFAGTGHVMTAGAVFRAVALFNALRFPLINLPGALSSLMSGTVSVKRVQAFLAAEDIGDNRRHIVGSALGAPGTAASSPSTETADAETASTAKSPVDTKVLTSELASFENSYFVRNATYKWQLNQPVPSLVNVSVKVPKGKLVGIVGLVGSGKSSLLAAMLGEMVMCEGEQRVDPARIGYVAQTNRRYNSVVDACGLRPDFEVLPGGDRTEIGDRGINLSGGQKQRVAIARAVYSDAELLLFDDPLSAVDANVGAHIFRNCVKGRLLRGRTCVMVTNQLHFLPEFDLIYVMRDGRVAECGTYSQLMASGEDLKQLMLVHSQSSAVSASGENTEAGGVAEMGNLPGGPRGRASSAGASSDVFTETTAVDSTVLTSASEAAKRITITEEEKGEGAVSARVYLAHFKAMGGLPMFGLVTLGVAGAQAAVICSDYWLAFWSSGTVPKGLFTDSDRSDNFYIAGLGVISAAAFVMLLLRSLLMAVASTRASFVHHDGVLQSVLRAPLFFFDTTPVGRILNRLSRDTDQIDMGLPNQLGNAWSVAAVVIGNFIAVSLTQPWFLLAMFGVLILLLALQRLYKPGTIALQRLFSTSRSPVFSHFSETLAGVATIRAFGATDRFVAHNVALLDVNAKAMYLLRALFRWATLRIEMLNSLATFAVALLVVSNKDSIKPAFAGAILNFALSTGGILGFAVIVATELEVQMNAVERTQFYTHQIPQERPRVVPSADPGPSWPSEGRVVFEDVQMRYREGLEPALQRLSTEVAGGSKVGVVGRTGSGKSTLMLALFRMYELNDGFITIDDVNVADIGLHRLRRALAIIPQDPVLFSGTVRSNLDPFGEYSDERVWDVLKMIRLADHVEGMPGKLEAVVEEYGNNFSVGQRQLLCMGRALLRNPKILVMDEATSSVDSDTDAFIQKMVRREFAGATLLTIAHRLNTIMDSDKILVLEQGYMREEGAPDALISQGGLFAELYHSAGH